MDDRYSGIRGFDSRHLSAIGNAVRNGTLRTYTGWSSCGTTASCSSNTSPARRAFGRSAREVQFGPDALHDVRSVTKSVVSLLYGIASHDGCVGSVERPLLDAFPEYPDLQADPGRIKILVKHALTMTMGTDWDESLPYSDPRNVNGGWTTRQIDIDSSSSGRWLRRPENVGTTAAEPPP